MKKITFDEIEASNTLILSATGRLAQSLRVQYDQMRAKQSGSKWITLRSKTVNQWLSELGEMIALKGIGESQQLGRVPLDTFTERMIWEQAIIEVMGDDAHYLFDVTSMAQTAVQANELVTVWNVPIKSGSSSKENQQFVKWREKFRHMCQQRGIVDQATLFKAIVSELILESSESLHLPSCIVFAGFDRYNPIDIELQRRLNELKVEVCELKLKPIEAVSSALSYPDAAAEILAATIWAKDFIEKQPKANIAIVVPDLNKNGDLVHDMLQDVLAPSTLHASFSEAPVPFNLSLGRSLDKYYLVSTALDLLEIIANNRSIGQDRFSLLLRSPYWSAYLTESATRAAIESQIRERIAPSASLERFYEFIKLDSSNVGEAPQLLAHLGAMKNASKNFSGRKKPSTWSEVFSEALKSVGWLQSRSLSSHERQTRSALFGELEKLDRLDSILGDITASQALSRFTDLCGERVFQPKTEGNPPIQVLGMLEASGLNFDAIWVTGMVDTTWPPPARPNPLLLADAQRAVGSPNSCAAVQLEFAQNIQRRLATSASQIIYSWPRTENTAELRLSPLIDPTLVESRQETPIRPHWIDETLMHPRAFLAIPIEDSVAPAVLADEEVKGGTWILRAQAICPAWAYFQFRLGAKELKVPIEGLDSSKKGILVHDVLKNFWGKVKSSAVLKSMNEVVLDEEISCAVDLALKSYDEDKKNVPLNPRYRKLERARLNKLVKKWITFEKERTIPFEVIWREQKISVSIGGIQTKMQADRIDQLESGKLLVIDYKTGSKKIDTKNWSSDRITEPQLPIYAAIHEHAEGEVIGVVFAKVLLKDCTVSGLAGKEGLLPKLNSFDSKALRKSYPESEYPDWPSVLSAWKIRLESIANEIKIGEAGIFFEDEKDLEYCEVKPLLRLNERRNQILDLQERNALIGEMK
jgi:exodeoxyribonuclease-5